MWEAIEWLEWGEQAFTRASAANVPILLSLVTAWSEECRAMDRTTFADAAVRAAVSGGFVAVRVDADQRPDVNERYSLGGWPTTAFLTADGSLLTGGTYLDVPQMLALCAQVSEAWRTRAAELRARAVRSTAVTSPPAASGAPDCDAVAHLRSLIVQRFDAVNGGFGDAPKLPHSTPLLLALSLASDEDDGADPELAAIAEITLDRMDTLWDAASGGFFRYADGADWSRPGAEKTLDVNVSLLHLYLEAASCRQSDQFRSRAGDLVRWLTAEMSPPTGGFYNARSAAMIDTAMYTDRNAAAIGGLLRAAVLFDDGRVRDAALRSFDAIVVPRYTPGAGMAHVADIRGLLADQIHTADAAIWAHVVAGQLPYSMLAAEIVAFALRAMWDESAGAFRDRISSADPVRPFELNCHAACVLDRLSAITGDHLYRDRAVAILAALAPEYARHDLFGAAYALAVREVIDGRRPAGLTLTRVEWHLEPEDGL